MPFAYAAGSVNSIAEFFTIFEAFITGIGWTVEAGSGTTDMIIRSLGEEGAYTMLWAHVRMDGATTGVIMDVQDDLAGTHVTTTPIWLTLAPYPCDYWMNGDMEFINVCVRTATPTWDYCGIGCLWEYALDLPDETYKMCASVRPTGGTMLRWHTGAWDVGIAGWSDTLSATLRTHPQDGSFTFMATFIGDDTQIAGQIPHISGVINATFAAGTQLVTTEDEGGATTWIVVADDLFATTGRFCMRTGGVLPIGTSEGSFAHEEALSLTPTELINNELTDFMTGLGWTDLGSAGIHTVSKLFYSTGETGADDIYIIVAYALGANDFIYVYLQDDAAGTHRTAFCQLYCDTNIFPMLYHLCGDKDCLLIARSTGGNERDFIWAGKVIPGAPDLDCTYHMLAYSNYLPHARLLRDCDGNWAQGFTIQIGFAQTEPSSPSLFDGITNVMWPIWARDTRAAGGSVMVGQLQYVYHIDSTYGLCKGDKVPVEDRNYLVCYEAAPVGWYTIRIE